MITPEEITVRAQRAYPALLRAWLRGEPFAPLSFPAGTPSGDYGALRREVERLLAGAKPRRGFGYEVELQTRSMRSYGMQSLPVRVKIDSAEDLLRLTGKGSEFAAFQADVAVIRANLPQLEGWLEPNVARVIEHHGIWQELLAVCAYFLANPRPGRYTRELPLAVHTKFIEEHVGILRRLLDALLPTDAIAADESTFEARYGLRYDEPLVRLRLLDPALNLELCLPLSDVSAPVSQVAVLPLGGRECIIVENKQVFLTLPVLPNCLALFGTGATWTPKAFRSWHGCAATCLKCARC
jgi:hypothetical protein